MLRFDRSLTDIAIDAPLSAAARRLIRQRLDAFWHFAQLASLQRPIDEETIHQLRVWSRRSATALRLFRDQLPRSRRKRMTRDLHQARRAAGEERELDVMVAWLVKQEHRDRKLDVEKLLGEIADRRRAAERPIRRVVRRLARRDLPLQLEELLNKVRPRGRGEEPTFAQAARASLQRESREFLAAGAGKLRRIEKLHAFRIRGKRFRYTLETLAGALPEKMQTGLYPRLVELQDLLGRVNDHASAKRWLKQWRKRTKRRATARLLKKLARRESDELRRARRKFRKRWTDEERAALQQAMAELLAPAAEGVLSIRDSM